ncbi:high affinity immunoglobulin epsilon receptor subunit gamma isoform X2 [Sceloporus undulatus]|uniref:high affinity immunoglobulin epsilon receptor subunit gamma isoform X2 n=1 Tax=Sceloporus undulatus TaxID=8520 RepID=UPI001C4CEB3F|nr:high affinity immunoglobulin epsilon receptor subunit gamma isoform X2 [Sceloporus undulatus]
MKWSLWIALILLEVEEADALQAPELCYVLDGILFVYGVVLTLLYCRLKIRYRKKLNYLSANIHEKAEGIYTGLVACETETYTTLELPKLNPQEEPPKQDSLVG